MAYNQNDLDERYRFIPHVRFTNGSGLNLAMLQDALQAECDANGIPVAFRPDVLKTGGFFNKQTEDIVILYNPEHPNDYLQFLLRMTYQGRYAFLDVFKVGNSTNYAHDNAAANGSAVRKIFNAFSGHNAKLEEEENYYLILKDCMEAVIS